MKVLAVIPGPREGFSMIFAKRQVKELDNLGANIESFYLQFQSLFDFPIQVFRLYQAFFKTRPDIIHAHYGTLTALLLCPLGLIRPLIITFRGSDLNIDPGVSFPRNWIGPLMSQLASLFAKKIICVSWPLKNKLLFARSKASVITDGVDFKKFRPIDKQTARLELGLSASAKILLFNNSKQPITKGIHFAQKVVSELEKKIQELEFIQLKGDTDPAQVPLYLNAADCLIFTSLSEGSPVIVKESLACNLPIASVEVGDTYYLLEDVENCKILNRNIQEFTDYILNVFSQNQRSNGRDFEGRIRSDIKNREVFELYQTLIPSIAPSQSP